MARAGKGSLSHVVAAGAPEGLRAFAVRIGARHTDIGEEAIVERGERSPFLRTPPPHPKGGQAPS